MTPLLEDKPNQYVIRFIAKVSWEGQANGLPPELNAYIIYEGDSVAEMNQIMESQAGAFARMQSMAVQKEQGKLIDLRQCPADRMLVPFRWIVSLSCDINRITGELSVADDDGIERLSDGSEPVKQ